MLDFFTRTRDQTMHEQTIDRRTYVEHTLTMNGTKFLLRRHYINGVKEEKSFFSATHPRTAEDIYPRASLAENLTTSDLKELRSFLDAFIQEDTPQS